MPQPPYALLALSAAVSIVVSGCTVQDQGVSDTTDASPDAEAVADPGVATRTLFAGVADDDPGCTVAVSRRGTVVFAEAYGAARLDPLEPMTVDTVVDIGSTSKQFTATAILLLAQRGLVDLDEPLATYLPGLPSWAQRPTMAQVMHHESGIPDYIGLLLDRGFELTGSSTDADALAALAEVSDLDFEPGSSWSYSNSNYFLMGQVVLSLTGDDLGTFLATEVFEPLGLEMVMAPVASIEAKAVSYEGVEALRTVADSGWQQLGDGGIQTTPTQLVSWASQYWAPTVGGPAINDERLAGAVDTGEIGRYGAGIAQIDLDGVGPVLTHSGGWGGFLTYFLVAPEQELAVAATCTSPETVQSLGIADESVLLSIWSDTAQGS